MDSLQWISTYVIVITDRHVYYGVVIVLHDKVIVITDRLVKSENGDDAV